MGANRLHAYLVFTQFEGLAVSAFPAKLRLRIDVLDYRGAPIPAVRVTTI